MDLNKSDDVSLEVYLNFYIARIIRQVLKSSFEKHNKSNGFQSVSLYVFVMLPGG